jgi:ABC-type uncharacterized transport system substrate-binding protein
MVNSMIHDLILKAFAILMAALWIVTASIAPARAEDAPRLNQGKKWRIGYYEGGPYSEYVYTMQTLVQGLIDLGWITQPAPPRLKDEAPKPYWDWLSNCNSPYLSFKPADAYSANWDDQLRTETKKQLMQKLKSGQLDLVIAMGTWAGQDLANNEHPVPTMVLSTSDPVQAGIIKSATESGLDHVTARVDPKRYLRQIRMFHRIVGFKTLGVAYEDMPNGKVYSALNEVNQVAKERGFKVVTCRVAHPKVGTELSNRSCLACYRQLLKMTDAVYVTALVCIDHLTPQLAEMFKEAKKPSFAMASSKLVEQGLMLSISSDSGYKGLGSYNAHKFGSILNGVKPSSLPLVFEDPLHIAVNMDTVRKVGFNIPKSLLRIATEIYAK